jgi:hypothetical protein
MQRKEKKKPKCNRTVFQTSTMPNTHQPHFPDTTPITDRQGTPKTLSKATVTQKKIKQMKKIRTGEKKGYYLSQYLPPRALFPLPLA